MVGPKNLLFSLKDKNLKKKQILRSAQNDIITTLYINSENALAPPNKDRLVFIAELFIRKFGDSTLVSREDGSGRTAIALFPFGIPAVHLLRCENEKAGSASFSAAFNGFRQASELEIGLSSDLAHFQSFGPHSKAGRIHGAPGCSI